MKWVVIGIELFFGMALGAAILASVSLVVGFAFYALLRNARFTWPKVPARFTWPKVRSVDYLWLSLIALAVVGLVKIVFS